MLEGLIERVERATGPGYELDCAIWDAIYPGERQERFVALTAKGKPYHLRLGPADMDGYVKPLRAFTASIDAAMTLAARGVHLTFDVHFMPEEDVIRYRGYSFQPDWAKWNPHDIEWLNRDGSDNPLCATPALALCAAGLRAQKEQANG